MILALCLPVYTVWNRCLYSGFVFVVYSLHRQKEACDLFLRLLANSSHHVHQVHFGADLWQFSIIKNAMIIC